MSFQKGGGMLFILAVLFFIAGRASADDILLKNGGVLPDDFFKTADETSEETQPETAGTPGDEKTKDNKLPYDLKIDASYEPQGDNVRVTVAGDAALPNGAMVEIYIKGRDRFIASGRTSVFDNRISMDFRFSRRRLFPAVYTVSVIFMPERQTPDIVEMLRSNFAFGTKVRTVEYSCKLYVGTLGDIVKTEVEAKCKIAAALAKLETLQNEFSDKFSAAKKKFVGRDWDKWSNTWLLYLKGIRNKQDSRNMFFPRAEDGITIAVNSILKLWQFCDLELKDPVKYNKVKNDPKARIRPDDLKKLFNEDMFNELLDDIRIEASMPRMGK